jgi:hypothetical protein
MARCRKSFTRRGRIFPVFGNHGNESRRPRLRHARPSRPPCRVPPADALRPARRAADRDRAGARDEAQHPLASPVGPQPPRASSQVERRGRSLHYSVDLDTDRGADRLPRARRGPCPARPSRTASLRPKGPAHARHRLRRALHLLGQLRPFDLRRGAPARSGPGQVPGLLGRDAPQHRTQPHRARGAAAQRPRCLGLALQAYLRVPAAGLHRDGFRLHRLRHPRPRSARPGQASRSPATGACPTR